MTLSGPPDRAALQDAMILHRRNYRETSLLLEALTYERGRLSLLAKGAKRGRASDAQRLQSFMLLRISWVGRGELPVLTAVEAAGEAIALSGTALYCGFYLNELLLRLLPPQDPCPEVFQLYLGTLARLAAAPQPEPTLRAFEVELLSKIGYGLCLDREGGSGKPVDPAKTYAYLIDHGPVETGPGRTDGIRGSTLLGLSRGSLDSPEALRESKCLLRRVIQHRLDGRALKSRDLFQPLMKPARP